VANRLMEPGIGQATSLSQRTRSLIRRLALAAFVMITGGAQVWVGLGVLRHEINPYWFALTSPLCFVGTVAGFIALARIISPRDEPIQIRTYRLRRRYLYQMPPPILARLLDVPVYIAEELHGRMNPWITPSWPLAFWLTIGSGLGAAVTFFVANLGGEPAWVVLAAVVLAILCLGVCNWRGEP
jgi:hypothetical protein